MKKQAYTMIAMMVLVGSLAMMAQAQTGGGAQLIANIPFEFSAGNKKLPAGKYVISVINPSSDQRVLQIRSIDGHNRTVLLMQPVEGKVQEEAKLVFNLYGDHYFFAQAWTPANGSGMQAPGSRAERNVSRELAAIKRQTKAIALTARQ